MAQRAIISISAAVTGTVAPIVENVAMLRIPNIIMDLFQLTSYAVAIIVGLIAIYQKCKKQEK